MTYDLVVIGSGPGGYVAAIRAAQLGLKVVCIEKDSNLGGTCLNVGCIPSKSLLHDSEHSTDLLAMMQRKEKVIESFASGIEYLFKKNKVERIRANAKIQTPNTVDADGKILETRYILLAAGSVPVELPFLPFDEEKILSSTGALSLKKAPSSMLVVGAGAIGLELGSLYSRLSCKVTFIEFLDRIAAGFDPEISSSLRALLEKQGMRFELNAKVVKAEGCKLILEDGRSFEAESVLVAVGRKPASYGFDLKKNARGFIEVDGNFRTSTPNIFAIGDLIDGPGLAHKASEEGVAVVELIAGHSPKINYAAIPNVIYTHPEAASVGFSEEQLKTAQIPYKAAKFPLSANSRARCNHDDDGFVKMLADANTHKIVGVHILGALASELIAEATLAIQLGATAEQLGSTCHAHPTLSEALKEAALMLFQAPIHL